jgi:Mg2+ and Co2+ transporter CorA
VHRQTVAISLEVWNGRKIDAHSILLEDIPPKPIRPGMKQRNSPGLLRGHKFVEGDRQTEHLSTIDADRYKVHSSSRNHHHTSPGCLNELESLGIPRFRRASFESHRYSPLDLTFLASEPGFHLMPMTVQTIPDQWYEDLGPGVRRLSPPGVDFKWIDLVASATTNAVIDDHARDLGLPPEFFDSLHERGFESGRRRFADSTLLRLELPAEVLTETDKDYDLIIAFSESTMLTLRHGDLGVIETTCNAIAQSGSGARTPLGTACELMDEFLDRVPPTIRRIAKVLDGTELERANARSGRIEKINQIRQVLLRIDRHLDPVQTMLQRCIVDFSTGANPRDLAALRGLQERTGWIEHRIDGQLERARILSEQDHIRAMDEMSGSMYRLSWIATIFLPLTFITGLLGINVKGIPFANDSGAFWMVCGILGLIALGTMIILVLFIQLGRSHQKIQLHDEQDAAATIRKTPK